MRKITKMVLFFGLILGQAILEQGQAQTVVHMSVVQPASISTGLVSSYTHCLNYPYTYVPVTAAGGVGPYTYVWQPHYGLNDTTISNPEFSPLVTTTYTLTVYDANQCSKSDTVRIEPLTCVGIEKNIATQEFGIFPNPTTGVFTVVLKPGVESKVKISITNAVGQVIKRIELQMDKQSLITQIDLSEFGRGIYVVNVDHGDKTSKAKVVIN